MKLTSKSEYTLLALIYMARQKKGAFVKIEDICNCYDIPKKYLEQQLQQQQADALDQDMAAGQASKVSQGSQTTQVSQAQNEGTWNCTCGKTGLTGKFCPECGNPRS